MVEHVLRPYEPRERRASGWAVAGAVLAVIAAIWLVWAYWGGPSTMGPLDGNRTSLSTITLGDIAENPQIYAGELVTVVGEVEGHLDGPAFVLRDTAHSSAHVLVLDVRGEAPAVGAEVVRVTGAVQVFGETQLESELDIELLDGAYAAWEGRPAIIARSISDASDGAALPPILGR